MKRFYWVGLLLSCVCLENSWAQNANIPKFTVDVSVVNEGGEPMDGVEVAGSFPNAIAPRERFGDTVKMITGKGGKVRIEGLTHSVPGVGAKMKGWYQSWPSQIDSATKEEWEELAAKRSVTVTMRKIVKPIPMYARRIDLELMDTDVGYGFDFSVGELVKPHGNGRVADATFTVKKSIRDQQSYSTSVEIRFPSPKDGIIDDPVWFPGCIFKGSYTCQMDADYRRARTFSIGSDNGVRLRPEKEGNYLFRIKSVERNGKLVSANYGKILGDVVMHPATKAGDPLTLTFSYYLNLRSNDTNLELDLRRNVSKDHRISIP